MGLSQKLGDVLEPRDHLRRQVDSSCKHQRQMGEHRHIGCLCFGARAARLAESDTIQAQEQCSEANEQSGNNRIPSSGWRAKVELTRRNSLMKIPSGGRPAIATTPSTRPQPSTGLVSVSPPMSAIFCVPLACAM